MEQKQLYEYNNETLKTFNLITFGKHEPEIKGSNSIRMLYGNDYDLFSVIKSNENETKLKNDIVKEFQRMGKKLKEHKQDIYFMYFMAGLDDDGKHKKWSLNDMITGRFKNDLNDRIKIEIVSYNNKFMPYSDVFEFYSPKFKNVDKITIDTIESLKPDIKKYYDEYNLMKVLKRLFIISQIKKDDKLKEKLQNIFNSNTSYLYSIISELKTMSEVLENYGSKIDVERVKNRTQQLKEDMSKIDNVKIQKNIYMKFDFIQNKKTSKTIIKILNVLVNKLMKIVNNLLEKQIKRDKINFTEYIT